MRFLFFAYTGQQTHVCKKFLNRYPHSGDLARKACAEPVEVSAKIFKGFLSDLSVLGGKTLSARPS
jgi:hypothetical protein